MKRFTIEITTGPIELDISEVWPDGDAPENPTAQDVLDLMLLDGLPYVLKEWNLDTDLEVTIIDNKLKKTVFWG